MVGKLVEVGEVDRVRLEVAVIAGELAEVAGNANGVDGRRRAAFSQTARPMPELAPVIKTRISDL